ncbi:hypothetical protein ILYODFUR_007709 [Ilyodon furcidens]|uniref:Uncharacterized protein n=1 Tax=Ilyodon furcidens TaxID=33524 RepID=A0ABV0U685_9TELE
MISLRGVLFGDALPHCSRHGSLNILFLIDQTHILVFFPGTADICPPSKINCVDKALGKKQSSFISFPITIQSHPKKGNGNIISKYDKDFLFSPLQRDEGRLDILKLLFLAVI